MKMKKMLAIVMAMVLMIGSIAIPVSAETITTSQMQTMAMTGSETSDTMKNRIEEAGVCVTDESTIQLVPISSSQNSALVITNVEGNTVTKDVLMMVTDEGIGFEQGSDVSTRAGTTVEFPPLSWDGRYVVRGTAVYNQYTYGTSSAYYQPVGVYFFYYKYEDCTVSDISVMYVCQGFEASLPNFEFLSEDEFVYSITVAKTNPSQSYMYSKTDEYNSNRVIYTGSGSPFIGQNLTFETVVDGEYWTRSVAI